MKFTLSWLKDYLITEASLDEVVEAMTLAGLEVEEVVDPANDLSQFSIAKIVKAGPHPNADKLQICTVKTVDGEKQIVCGAPNARKGLVTIYAPLGAYIPGLDFSLDKKPRKIRDVESFGMLCSPAELGLEEDDLKDNYDIPPETEAIDGITEIDDDLLKPKVGDSAAGTIGLDDPVIEFEVTPNRPDWLGVTGIARDLAAAGLGKLKIPAIKEIKGDFPCTVDIKTEDPKACPVFMGRIIRGVKNRPSPPWLRKRLRAIGIKPRNMLVDVTNFVAYDRCRPLHAYDADLLDGTVTARMAKEGDAFTDLNDAKYAFAAKPDDKDTTNLTDTMCIIADAQGPVGLGGIIGGARTGSSLETNNVFLEAAWFDPMTIARTGRDLKISTDARYRFERGVDPTSCREGIDLATKLILEYCGGEASEVNVAGSVPEVQGTVDFKPVDMERLTGVKLSTGRMKKIFSTLGFEVPKDVKATDQVWPIKPPGFRRDVEQSADFVEELIRIEGFDALPEDALPKLEKHASIVTPLQNRIRVARRVMAARGFQEAVTWSFMDRAQAETFSGGQEAQSDSLALANPITTDLNYMRPSVLANLAQAIQYNANHGAEDVKLFEAGPIYLTDAPEGQTITLASLVRPRPIRHWSGNKAYDVYQAKADLFALLDALGQPGHRFQIAEPSLQAWHPGRAGELKLGKNLVARFGDLHPATLKQLGVEGPLTGFEVMLNALPLPKAKAGKTKPPLELSELNPIRRDFAFLVGDDVAANDIEKAAAGADKKLVTSARIFDLYKGEGVPAGQKSIAIEVVIQPRDKNLTDQEIESISQKIVGAVSKATKATLRA